MILHTNSAGVLVIHLVIYCDSLLGLPNPGKVAAGSLRWCLVFAFRCSESGKLLTMLILSVSPLEVVFGSIMLADCWGAG